jgi:secreted trypsin-like serine protease
MIRVAILTVWRRKASRRRAVTGRRVRGLAASAVGMLASMIWFVPPAHAVAGGSDVPDGKYRFAAALSMPLITRPNGSTYSSACSGALVAPSWVITAGHCLHDGARNRISGPPRYEVQVMVGRETLSGTGGATRQVVEVRQSSTEDVALIRLDQPVFTVLPIVIAHRAPRAGDVLRLTGWGSADAEVDLSHRPDRLQTGLVEVSSFTDTDVLVHGLAPHPTTSACPYDSGAPYFREVGGVAVLVATEAIGPDCPHDQNETAARIDTIAPWVIGTLTGTL